MPVNIIDPTMKMLDAGLRAMESDNKGKILANPSVVALDGQKATIKLTHNYLYQSGLDESGNPEFTEQQTGPTLDITPTIGRDGFVTLKLKISTGEIVQFRDSGISEVPETTKREVDTQIRVRDGELFVIGGLYQENKTKGVTRVPILSYIPLIGELFKSKTDKHSKSEMAFIVMPHILDVPTGAAEIFDMPGKSLIQ
jgi:type IV pilus assembly protein PilQ